MYEDIINYSDPATLFHMEEQVESMREVGSVSLRDAVHQACEELGGADRGFIERDQFCIIKTNAEAICDGLLLKYLADALNGD